VIVVTSDERIAKGLSQTTFVQNCKQLRDAGYLIVSGEIVGKRQSDGANVPTAQKTIEEGIPPRVGGNFSVEFDPPPVNLVSSSAPALTVSGNKVRRSGADYVLKGVSMASIGNEWTDDSALFRLNKVIELFPDCNVIRFPCQPEHITQYGLTDFITYWLDPAVGWCQSNGYYCIIDWHRIGSWNDADTLFRAFWDTVAPRYKDLSHVLYELFNEPDGPHDGFQASSWNTFKTTMQTWVDHIKTMAPNVPLIVGSPLFDQYTQYIPANPITGSNIIYTHHVYPNHVPGGSVVDYQGNPVAATDLATKTAWMDTNFGNASDSIPVILTEWGYALTDVGFYLLQAKSRASFAEPLMDYCAIKGIGYTAWSLDPLSAPAMQNGDGSLSDFGQYVESIL
jgi:endoglucanase